MTVNVTNTVGANNTIVLDGSSKIPAIDGSQVTALSGSAFTTGTLATARIDVGTGANQILQLDANAKLPALSATNLTNVPGPTVSTSDPAIDTNSTLGAKWVNKTSGEVYICTDATTDENIWTNVGPGSGDVAPYSFPGTQYGYTSGGYAGGGTQSNIIEKFSFTTTSNATDVGDMTGGRSSPAGCSSLTHGYVCGGNNQGDAAPFNIIDKFSFSTDGNASDIGDLAVQSTSLRCGGSSQTNGYTFGGNCNPSPNNAIQKFSFSSDGNASDIGDTHYSANDMAPNSSGTYCYHSGGIPAVNSIGKVSTSTDGNSTSVGTLTTTRGGGGGASSLTYGYTAGGASSNVIDKFSFSSDGNASDVGDLTAARKWQASPSSTTYGYSAGGNPTTNLVERWSFSSDGNAVDSTADLTRSHDYLSNGHNY
jgi:hypothetical protein